MAESKEPGTEPGTAESPVRAVKNVLRKMKKEALWRYNYFMLRRPKRVGWAPYEPSDAEDVIEGLKGLGLEVSDLTVTDDYWQYRKKAEYEKFPDYYEGGGAEHFVEKSLEHYLAAQLLELGPDDVYIDIASFNSPVAEIYEKLYGCDVYRQDLLFPAGLEGNQIGGDAGAMPVEDGFATKMALHCSLEHFEGDSDIAFIKEVGRVLRPGGKVCILPLYMLHEYAIQTDPSALPMGGIPFEHDAVLYCARGYENRHGRFYDLAHFAQRILGNLGPLSLRIVVVRGEKEIAPSCHVKIIAVLEKREGPPETG